MKDVPVESNEKQWSWVKEGRKRLTCEKYAMIQFALVSVVEELL